MNEFIKISVIALIGVILALTVKKTNGELALIISITTGIGILFVILSLVGNLLTKFIIVFDGYSLPKEVYEPLLKCVFISITSKICGELCRQSGESALAVKVDLAGNLAGVIVAFPLLEYALSLIWSIPMVN